MAAGPAEAQDAGRLRLLRPHPVGARRVRLLGVRRRLAAGAAAVVELPQGGRRRHHRRHAVPLALRARQPVRRGEGGVLPRRDAHSAALGRERQAVRGHRRRRRLRDVRARRRRAAADHRADQQLVVHARAPRRPRDVPRRRHARLGGGRAHRLPDPAARGDAQAGVESRRAADDRLLRRRGRRCRRIASTTTRSRSSGSCSCATSSTTRRSRGTCSTARKGVQLAELGLQSWRERRWSTCRRCASA